MPCLFPPLNKPLVCHNWVKNAVYANLSAWGMHLLFYLLGSTNLRRAQCDIAGAAKAQICVVRRVSVAITIRARLNVHMNILCRPDPLPL